MQWVTLKANGWGRLDLVRKEKEKTSKGRHKGGMTIRTKSQALALGLT
jgi:hypothetical protein